VQIFDAIIIGSSFAIDIIFLGGVAGEEGQKAAAVLVVLLLWRIARVVDGTFNGCSRTQVKSYQVKSYRNLVVLVVYSATGSRPIIIAI